MIVASSEETGTGCPVCGGEQTLIEYHDDQGNPWALVVTCPSNHWEELTPPGR